MNEGLHPKGVEFLTTEVRARKYERMTPVLAVRVAVVTEQTIKVEEPTDFQVETPPEKKAPTKRRKTAKKTAKKASKK